MSKNRRRYASITVNFGVCCEYRSEQISFVFTGGNDTDMPINKRRD